MQTLRMIQGDCFDRLRSLTDGSVGAVVSDPPYGFEFMGVGWDAPWKELGQAENPNDVEQNKTGSVRGWETGAGMSKPGIGARAIPWPSFGHNHTPFDGLNPTCVTCGGRMRGSKRCDCKEPQWKAGGRKWDINGKLLSSGTVGAGFTIGGSERFSRSSLPSFTGSTPNWICANCGGTMRGGFRKGFHPCQCEEPDFPGASEYNVGKMRQMQTWHEGWLREIYRVLQPGGVAKVFAATRTMHRLAAAMEAVGFEIIGLEAWCYGSGFPKSMDVSKAIDKMTGVDPDTEVEIRKYLRERRDALGLTKGEVDKAVFGGTTRYSWVEGRGDQAYLPTPEEWEVLKGVLQLDDRYDEYIKTAIPSREMRSRADGGKSELVAEVAGDWGYQSDGQRWDGMRRITTSVTPVAKRFDGYGTALKPAWEPFVIGRKTL